MTNTGGMHDGPLDNSTYPGQLAPPDNYAAELANITDRLIAFGATSNAKLVFAATTPYMCNATQNGCVLNLNNQAAAVMAARNIPVLKTYDSIVSQCGQPPNQSCFGDTGCYCEAGPRRARPKPRSARSQTCTP